MIKIRIALAIIACICLFGYTPPSRAQEVSNDIRSLLSSQGKVVFGDEPNSIIVIDYPDNIERVADFLKELDTPPQQVLIEARVVEVKLQKEHLLGVNWKVLADRAAGNAGSLNIKSGILAKANSIGSLGNINFFPTAQSAFTSETPFTFAIFGGSVNAVLQTLASSLDTNILSAPKITTVNNREAQIKVIQRLPWAEPTITVDDSGSASTSWTVNFEEVGIILKVTPMINENRDISLTLTPEISEKTSDYPLTATASGTSVTYTIPVIDSRNASTKVVVGDGQTLIIGGLIKDKITKGESKLPVLGDIPYVGHLFKSKKDAHDKTELLIFVSPKIITPDDLIHMSTEEKTLWDNQYLETRQKLKETTLKEEAEKKVLTEALNAKVDMLLEKQNTLVEERKKLETAVAKEEENLKSLQDTLK